MKEKEKNDERTNKKSVVSKPIHANKNAWIENQKWSLFQQLQTYDWIFFHGVSSRLIFFGQEIKNKELSPPSSSLLKPFQNRDASPPFASLLGH